MNLETRFGHESLFEDLFEDKPSDHRFAGFSDSSLYNDMIGGLMDQNNYNLYKSVDQMYPPIYKNCEDAHLDYKDKILKEEEMTIEDQFKESFVKLDQIHIRQYNDTKVGILDIGADGVEDAHDFLKQEPLIKPIEVKDENLTEFDEAEEEEDDSFDAPKKQRKDVSYKTILRKCRKYYQQRFNAQTGFLRNKKKEPCSFYRDCILRFIEDNVSLKTTLNISFHMGALLYPQEMIKRIESFVYPDGIKNFTPKKVVKRKVDTHKQQVDKLHSILYKFTHEKLEKFISVPELAAIFLNYIEQSGEEEIQDEDYTRHIKDLTKR